VTAPPDAAWNALADGDWRSLAPGLAVALGCGLLVGLERERRKRRRGPAGARAAAGIRTFAVAALAGALAQALAQPWLVAVGAALVAVLVALAYRYGRQASAGSSHDDPGLTTELALLVTYLIGVLAMRVPTLAAAVAVVLAVLLSARERLHRFATALLTEAELHDALLLAALALVLLPLVPAAPAAWLAGIAPRSLLLLLLLILLLQAAGHVALRWLGPRAGLALAGLASGFVSSTATIATLGARVRAAPAEVHPRATGAVFSAVATWLQALAMLFALAPAAALALLPAAAAGMGVTLAAGLWLWWRDGTPPPDHAERGGRGPLHVREAALVAVALTLVTLLVGWLQHHFGAAGRTAGVALAAIADTHSAIAALSALNAAGQLDAAAVRDGALLAIGVNSLTRGGVAFAAGGGAYGRRVAATLAAAMAAALATAWAAKAAA
jgi:uncharacterized membrane protein (DUF4010 family)